MKNVQMFCVIQEPWKDVLLPRSRAGRAGGGGEAGDALPWRPVVAPGSFYSGWTSRLRATAVLPLGPRDHAEGPGTLSVRLQGRYPVLVQDWTPAAFVPPKKSANREDDGERRRASPWERPAVSARVAPCVDPQRLRLNGAAVSPCVVRAEGGGGRTHSRTGLQAGVEANESP